MVSNLPEDVTAGDLADMFDEFGLVLTARIRRRTGPVGQPPQGWVDLAPAKSVDRAIESLNGRLVGTRKLKVRKVPPHVAGARKPAHPAPPPRG